MVELSRRSFLVAAGGTALLAACGGSSNGSGDAGSGDSLTAGRLSIDVAASDEPQRFAFGVFDASGPASGPEARIRFVSPAKEAGEPVRATLRGDGLPDRRGVYVVETVFGEPGQWVAEVEVGGRRAEFPVIVTPEPQMPARGEAAPPVPSPTAAAPLGVDPICTREPPCDLHAVSLDQVVGRGKPVAVLFATPARCQSQYCGPVLDTLLDALDGSPTEATVVHVEIYRGPTTQELVPTVTEWGIAGEPVLYGVDASGTIVGMLDGAFDRGEIEDLLSRL